MLNTFLLAMLVATLVLLAMARLAVGRLERQHYEQKADFFRRYPIQPGDIVFLGDSITDGACWDEVFPGLPVKNRGINADTSQGVLRRLGEILRGQPAALFILIGTNDLPVFAYRTDDEILDTYTAILERCRAEAPATRVYVQSILPRGRAYAHRITTLNARLAELAAQSGTTFIDLFPHFATPEGELRPEFTNDHLHLLAPGYACWAEILRPYVEFPTPIPSLAELGGEKN
jgi:lysophospholipase L1-like esterase